MRTFEAGDRVLVLPAVIPARIIGAAEDETYLVTLDGREGVFQPYAEQIVANPAGRR